MRSYSAKIVTRIIGFLTAADIMHLLSTNATFNKMIKSTNFSYDLIILQHLQETKPFNLSLFVKATKQLSCLHSLKTYESDDGKNILWQEMVWGVKNTLTVKPKYSYAAIEKKLQEDTLIVASFNANRMNTATDCYLNHFLLKGLKKTLNPTRQDDAYTNTLFTTQLAMYIQTPLTCLKNFLETPLAHPCYGSLQPINKVSAILTKQNKYAFGSSFIVFNSELKQQATAVFGNSLDRVFNHSVPIPVPLTSSYLPLISEFPPDLLAACEVWLKAGLFPKDYQFYYDKHKSNFIEVHFPAALSLNNPKHVEHLHFSDWFNVESDTVEKHLLNGINVSIGQNPFAYVEFGSFFQRQKAGSYFESWLLSKLKEAAYHLAETTGDYLELSLNNEKLIFKFKISPNAPYLHQAQVAHLLYLLGVRKYFQTHSVFSLDQNFKEYVLPLDNSVKQEGGLDDHDAYTILTLRHLLNKMLKRIFSIYLVCKQNENWLLKFNVPHPNTGAGATEASNLTRELKLQYKDQDYDFDVNWVFDRILLTLNSSAEIVQYVVEELKKIFKSIKFEKNKITFDSPLSEMMVALDSLRFNYQSVVIFDDFHGKTYGNLWLANRFGFCTPGGHNNDPYSDLCHFQDIEIGKINVRYSVLQLSGPCFYKKSLTLPSILYCSLPKSWIKDFKADGVEFAPDSLRSYSFADMRELSLEKLSDAAKILNLSPVEYKKYFGQSLALRPVFSIYHYLNHVHDIFLHLIKTAMPAAKHNQLMRVKNNCFLIADSLFGIIKIDCNKKIRTTLKYLCILNGLRFAESDTGFTWYHNPQILQYLIQSTNQLPASHPQLELDLPLLLIDKNPKLLTIFSDEALLNFLEDMENFNSFKIFKKFTLSIFLYHLFVRLKTINDPSGELKERAMIFLLQNDCLDEQLRLLRGCFLQPNSLEHAISIIDFYEIDVNCAFHTAVCSDNLMAIQLLLERYQVNFHIRTRGDYPQSILYLALAKCGKQAIEYLFNYSIQLGTDFKEENLPELLVAEQCNSSPILYLLLSGKGNHEFPSDKLITFTQHLIKKYPPSLHLLAKGDQGVLTYNVYAEAVPLLVAAGADFNEKTKEGDSPLHFFLNPLGDDMNEDDALLLAYMLTCGGKKIINEKNNRGDTALHIAIRLSDLLAVIMLVDAGASLTIFTANEETPLMLAEKEAKEYEGNEEAEAILIYIKQKLQEQWLSLKTNSSGSDLFLPASAGTEVTETKQFILS